MTRTRLGAEHQTRAAAARLVAFASLVFLVSSSQALAASGSRSLDPPLDLPAAGSVAARAEAGWILGVRPQGAHLARRFGGRPVSARGAFVVPRARARALATILRRRGLLVYAEPNRRRPRKTARDPLSDQAGWRDYVVDPALNEPNVGPASPQLALIDTPVDFGHPEFASGHVTTTQPGAAVFDLHGTATAAVAAAPVNGRGIVGVWPGMRAVNLAAPERLTCADSARGIAHAIRLRVHAINMSYGSGELCFAEYVELQFAVARGIVPVAAAGNEFNAGNPLEFPASLPHVLTVAAIGPDLRPAYFSNENAAVDLAAPGIAILTAVPPAFDEDGSVDGYARVNGTSFSAPMAAAAVAWVRAVRPGLTADQAAQVVRLSARDLHTAGWDPATGFGLLDIDAALLRRPPPADPFEPNDGIVWVDGRAFGRADAPIYRHGSLRSFRALLDRFEDPEDVYRVRVPARTRLLLQVRPFFGDPALAVFRSKATTTSSRSHLIDRSERSGRATERVTVVNRSRRAIFVFAVAYVNERTRELDSAYRMIVRRLRFRR
jgi:hypothetical protein